jgi:hypothetical protein
LKVKSSQPWRLIKLQATPCTSRRFLLCPLHVEWFLHLKCCEIYVLWYLLLLLLSDLKLLALLSFINLLACFTISLGLPLSYPVLLDRFFLTPLLHMSKNKNSRTWIHTHTHTHTLNNMFFSFFFFWVIRSNK